MAEPKHNKIKNTCGNCHSALGNAEYCSHCGQKNTDGRITVREFFSVAINTVFNLESKFFQTIRDIVKPGKLTIEWFKGRHKPYFHPIRLFIVTALLLIAVLSLFITEDNSFQSDDTETAQRAIYRKEFIKEIDNFEALFLKDEKEKTIIDSLARTMREGRINNGRNFLIKYGLIDSLTNLEDKSIEEIISYYESELGPIITDSLVNVIKTRRASTQDSVELSNLVGDGARHKIANEDFVDLSPTEIADKYKIEGFFRRLHFKQRIRLDQSGKNLGPFVLGNSLWVALLMMPFLALILKLLYFRHDYYYVEHLIFSFHAHSFAFILFSIVCLFLKKIYFHPAIVFVGLFSLFIYVYLSLRAVYQQGKWKTLFKLLFANVVYVVMFGAFALMGFLVSIFIF